ncbi:hypothetical protein ABTA48_19775, partial [Acinetobacter baumannii]
DLNNQPKTSTRKAEAARRNGSKSRGPVTPEGKRASSKNALKHGFSAKNNVLIDVENSEAWTNHLAGFRASFHPANPVEQD